jgi:hypothetical protein
MQRGLRVITLQGTIEKSPILTRTKTSIGYAKENDREKRKREGEREREKGRRRYIEREGEIREREG